MSKKNNHGTSNVFGPKSWVIVKAGKSGDSVKYAGKCIQIGEMHFMAGNEIYLTGYSDNPRTEGGIWLHEIERLATPEEIAAAQLKIFEKMLEKNPSLTASCVHNMGMCKYTSASIARKDCTPKDGAIASPQKGIIAEYEKKFPKGAKVRVIADPEIEFTVDEAFAKDTHYDDFVIRDVIYWTGKGRKAVGYSEAELELVPPKKPWPLGKKFSSLLVRDLEDEVWFMRELAGINPKNKFCFRAAFPDGTIDCGFSHAAPFTRQNFNRLRKNLKAELRGVQTRETIKQYEIPDELLVK